MSTAPRRAPHAVLDLDSRRAKALKIERLLKLADRPSPLRILEIGTGSGGIAHYFATHPLLRCAVTAVDVVDQRQVRDCYDFRLVHDTSLPFAAAGFDVVLSNHVIEHVGERPQQLDHLREMRRVMAPGGVAYLAVPNRWMIVEPHYRLAFLSWLPCPLRTPYLRAMRRGERYDCEPVSAPQLDALLDESGLAWRHIEVEALRVLFTIEGARGLAAHIAERLPDRALNLMRHMVPTLICRLAHPARSPVAGAVTAQPGRGPVALACADPAGLSPTTNAGPVGGDSAALSEPISVVAGR